MQAKATGSDRAIWLLTDPEDALGASRIIAGIQALDLSGGSHMLNLSDNSTEQNSHSTASGTQHGAQIDGAAAEEGDQSRDAEGGAQEEQNEDEDAGWTDDDSGEEDVEWQVVAKSQNSARRKKRRVPLLPSFSLYSTI